MPLKHSFPSALLSFPNWIVADNKGAPYNPFSGHLVSVAKGSWCKFDLIYPRLEQHIAEATAERPQDPQPFYRCLGFVLTEEDPYVVIDLDDKNGLSPIQKILHDKVVAMFAGFAWCYTSQGGRGRHLWLDIGIENKKDLVEKYGASGRSRETVQVYWNKHYMRIPVWAQKEEARWQDNKRGEAYEKLQLLIREMPAPKTYVDQFIPSEESFSEWDLNDALDKALDVSDKTLPLCNGEWEGLGYPSQSEADFALMNILLSVCSPQMAKNLFLHTALGQRGKAKRRDYLNRMIHQVASEKAEQEEILRSFIEEHPTPTPAPVDEATYLPPCNTPANNPFVDKPVGVEEFIPPTDHSGYQVTVSDSKYDIPLFPPGVVGELAQHFLDNATRPVAEVALVSALGLLSGICSRSWNISKTGLNLYLILIAKTGIGKEQVSVNIDSVLTDIQRKVPAAKLLMGPGTFASAPGLHRAFTESHTLVSVLGEIGLTLRNLCSKYANATDIQLKKLLLLLFNKSGKGNVLSSTVYSDAQKNLPFIEAPALSIIGESTPENFYEGLEEGQVMEGLIPRFLVVEYKGKRSLLQHKEQKALPEHLFEHLCGLIAASFELANRRQVIDCSIDDKAALLLTKIDLVTTELMNSLEDSVQTELWNRAHLNTLRVAGTLAVCRDPLAPVVIEEDIIWAYELVKKGILNLAAKFDSGQVGGVSNKQNIETIICEYIASYHLVPRETRKNCKCPDELLDSPLVSYYYLYDKCKRRKAFKEERYMSPAKLLKTTLADMVDGGILIEINKAITKSTYGGPATTLYGPGSAFPKRILKSFKEIEL